MINDWNLVWLFLVSLLLMENIIHGKLTNAFSYLLSWNHKGEQSKTKIKYFSDEKQELFVF